MECGLFEVSQSAELIHMADIILCGHGRERSISLSDNAGFGKCQIFILHKVGSLKGAKLYPVSFLPWNISLTLFPPSWFI